LRTPGRLVFLHDVEPVLRFKPIVDERPGTILVFVDLALAIVGAAARTVKQAFVTCCDGTDACGIAQYAVSALVANLMEIARAILHPDEKGIQSRDDRLIYI
jgi:hypothetical protein